MRHMPEQQGMDACQSALAIAYITFITFESFLCVALGNAVPPVGAVGGATCPVKASPVHWSGCPACLATNLQEMRDTLCS